jgi:hypothetical protein
MARTTKRRFTDEFKREAVALWETSGRMQTEVAVECLLGTICPCADMAAAGMMGMATTAK